MFFRSTVATLGVMFAVAVAGQAVFVAVLGDSALRWVLPTNIAAFLFNGYEYYDGSSGDASASTWATAAIECGGGMAHLSLAFGTTYLLVLLGIAVGLSAVVVPAPRRALTRRARGHVHRNWVPSAPA